MKTLVSKTKTVGRGGPMALEVSDETYERFSRMADMLELSTHQLFDELTPITSFMGGGMAIMCVAPFSERTIIEGLGLLES